MSLIENINGNLLSSLSGAKGSSTRRSATASSGGLDLSVGLSKAEDYFAASFNRLGTASSTVEAVSKTLEELHGIAVKLSRLAESAATDDPTIDRSRLETTFRQLVHEYDKVRERAEEHDQDLLDKGDLKKVLSESGIDFSSPTELAASFRELAGSDQMIGFSYVTGELGVADGQAVAPPRDPRDNHLLTRAESLAAADQLEELVLDVEDDLANIRTIADEIRGARQFALAAYNAAGALIEQGTTGESADSVAVELVRGITNRARDNALGAHSNLDSILNANLTA